jgi:hypothetical protein
LLHLLKALTRERRPLEFPTILIQRGIEAYSKRLPNIDLSVSENNDDIWQVLLDPTLLDEAAMIKWSQPLRKFEEEFLSTHRSARPHFQDLFSKGESFPKSAAELLIYCRSIARSGYGARNAGNVDIWFGAYLAQVDRFVTNDLKQYQTLRLVARMFAPKCEILKYDSFRQRLVIETSA